MQHHEIKYQSCPSSTALADAAIINIPDTWVLHAQYVLMNNTEVLMPPVLVQFSTESSQTKCIAHTSAAAICSTYKCK